MYKDTIITIRGGRVSNARSKAAVDIRLRSFLLLGVLLLTFLLTTQAHADGQWDFAAKMDAQMPGLLASYKVPGAVAAYIQDGVIASTHAYGTANLSSSAAMRPEMVFNFGSCGKILTAWGVMRLVEEGKLDLDDPANQYLKRWKKKK